MFTEKEIIGAGIYILLTAVAMLVCHCNPLLILYGGWLLFAIYLVAGSDND